MKPQRGLPFLALTLVGCFERQENSSVLEHLDPSKAVEAVSYSYSLKFDTNFNIRGRGNKLHETKEWHFLATEKALDLEALVIDIAKPIKEQIRDLGGEVYGQSKLSRPNSLSFHTVSFIDEPFEGEIRILSLIHI